LQEADDVGEWLKDVPNKQVKSADGKIRTTYYNEKIYEKKNEVQAIEGVPEDDWKDALEEKIDIEENGEWKKVKSKKNQKESKQIKNKIQKELRLLERIEDFGQVNVVGNGWEELSLAVDSGATETVVSSENATTIPTVPGAASRAGVRYAMANGDAIENEGEKIMLVGFTEGVERLLTAQVTDVTKPLLSVSQMVKAGNTVVFSPGGSYIWEESSGEYMEMELINGMYMLKVWVKKPDFQGHGNSP